jgi:hypothetical protein
LILVATTASVCASAQEVSAGMTSSSREGAFSDALDPLPEAPPLEPSVKQLWDLGVGYAIVRFNSSLFTASTSGLVTSIGYHLSDHFALEGQITSTFGDPNPGPYDAKYLFYGAGPALSRGSGRVRPWGHALIGGLHMFPQTQFSNNSIAVLAGGGADVRWKPRVWIRFEGDYVRSQLYRTGQNSFQFVMGIVHRF